MIDILQIGGIRMKIKGIGTISKKEAMSILTREGREAVKNGDITTQELGEMYKLCLLYTSPSPRDLSTSRMPSSA